MYSNSYVFRYAIIMVVVVAAVLSTAALLLKPAQDRNIAVAKMQGILAAAQVQATSSNAVDLYERYILEEIVIDPQGEVIGLYKNGAFETGDVRAFHIDLKKEQYNKAVGADFKMPLYYADIDGQKMYIIPLLGKGLWGPVYGNIALGEDFNTIVGASFGHDKETPGLGAEIEQVFFQEQFIGKKIMDESGKFVSVQVVRGGAAILPVSRQIHGVDAISGGTITSNGVSEMLESNLKNYIKYFKKQVNI
ncbi:MAG: NADH:ubiquinone reductase (Na(+)-transporting) subunit C [Bacteroidales bacterium]|nr:NADH:ubiquinone reductase (Na(+)-transporting) subunit C [Bacteroidales bacterium]